MQWLEIQPLSLQKELELEKFKWDIKNCNDLESLQNLSVQLFDHCSKLQMILNNAVHHIAELEEQEFIRGGS